MVEILIATHNKHKVKEFKEIINREDIKLMSLDDLNDQDDVIEDGSSFFENALIKAKYYANKYHKVTISDDSGLVVDALDGRPGIYSARYSGLGDLENNKKVLEEMKDIDQRKARFEVSIVLCYPNGVYRHYEGQVQGYIANDIKGNQGFGYDTIFYVPEYQKTFGEIDSYTKHLISHRGVALRKFKEDLDEIINHI
ncbi:MAG: non-canonical purine NTP pyrophosphatase, RdgB/HAM1 family [Tenericutes bacterium HGW-Tenericutes-6]|nr:MAG: non-canonical purine NTP pyrophosphatase, RdgB/HAM1 family [Tenericutes bacterium HGW-Tenericutes-6]